MFDLFVPKAATPKAQFEADLLGGVVTLAMDGYRLSLSGTDTTIAPTVLKAIPYYAWNNRGVANMRVWLSTGKEGACSQSSWGQEMAAKASSSLQWVWGLNTGFDPKSSADIDKSYYYFWQSQQAEEWVQYDFPQPATLTESKVYWLHLDHYDGNYRVPQSWRLMVQDADKRWVPVVTNDPYGLALDQYNTVSFTPVKTAAIRMMVKMDKENSVGILAWKVF